MEQMKKDFWLMTCIIVILAAALFYLTVPKLAHADPVIRTFAGVNGIWIADDARPADFELGANAAASLSPHVSAVGALYYGIQHSYVRGSVGARFTVTDVDNPNFSIGLGGSYNASTEPAIRPEEWCLDAAVGWRPWVQQPRITLIALGQYGTKTSEASYIAGARYTLQLP